MNWLAHEPFPANELVRLLDLKTKTGAFKRAIKELLEAGQIAYTIPDKPKSRLQKYQLTGKGKAALGKMEVDG